MAKRGLMAWAPGLTCPCWLVASCCGSSCNLESSRGCQLSGSKEVEPPSSLSCLDQARSLSRLKAPRTGGLQPLWDSGNLMRDPWKRPHNL